MRTAAAEAEALVASAKRYNELHPAQPLRLVALPYDAFANKLRVAVPRVTGPIFSSLRMTKLAIGPGVV